MMVRMTTNGHASLDPPAKTSGPTPEPPEGIIFREWHRKFAWIAFGFALLANVVLLEIYIRHTTSTFDEGTHISAGHRYWQCGDYGSNPEHPPLLKLVATWPLRHWQLGEFSSACGAGNTSNMGSMGNGYRLINSANGDLLLRKARQAAMLFPIMLTVTVFFVTWAWFGPLAAGIAVLLTAFEPNLTAHGPLVTTDMALTSTTLLTVAMTWSFLQRRSVVRLLLLGTAMGLALASKHSAVLVPFTVLLIFGVDQWRRHKELHAKDWALTGGGWLLACLIAVVVLWSTYGFRFHALPGAPPAASPVIEEIKSTVPGVTGTVLASVVNLHLLPESYVQGLVFVKANASRETYVFGRQLASGVWYYFPLTIAIKTPVTLLALIMASLLTAGLWRSHRRPLIIVWMSVVVFLLAGILSKMNIGVRHILPACPFLVIMAAAAAAYWTARSRKYGLMVAGLLIYQAISYLHGFPNEIAYANELWGGPRQLHRYLGDSNVDWGQSAYQVRDYVARHPGENCWVAWFGVRKLDALGVPCHLLTGPVFLESSDPSLPDVLPDRFEGTVLISAPLTDYDLFPYGDFLRLKPDDVIDGGVLVFHGRFDIPQIAADRRVARGWWYLNHGKPSQAAEEFALAEAHAHSRGILHSLYAWALMSTGHLPEARTKCLQAAEDFANKPAYASARQSALKQAAEIEKMLNK